MTSSAAPLTRLREETGASSVELLVFFPLLMLIILVTVQVALSWYGNEVAIATARETARVVREGGTTAAELAQAEADGAQYATRVGGGRALTHVNVHIAADGDQARITVTGTSMDIIGGLAPGIEATVTAPIETFREDT
ncbi:MULTISPECIES: TadE family protein [unclassified Actinomyces]|uniref:TadE family protein n=1 Tax=unclassified Actinomyces TaxID=2609248 RepID=UPI0013742838|nr:MULTISPECIES: TadE family protein [unclassified Actinomyces]NDR53237.1 pilus assembly protein [Actinomyces sp. 565]QHO90780.1 peptidase M20 [Actinomyces sp. 432]